MPDARAQHAHLPHWIGTLEAENHINAIDFQLSGSAAAVGHQ